MALDVLEVGERAGELPAVDGLSSLARVLVRDTEVGAARAGGLGGLEVGGGVSDLVEEVLLVFVVSGGMAHCVCVGVMDARSHVLYCV